MNNPVKSLKFWVIILALLWLGLEFKQELADYLFYRKTEWLYPLEERAAEKIIEEIIPQSISAPTPLKIIREKVLGGTLTVGGVLAETNRHRIEAGLAPLGEDAGLARAAAFKLQDMFAKNYFAHDSPSGEGADTWVKAAGYESITVGENLAMGRFEDDKALVEAWMASPGHRENILAARFQEIGVAAGRGVLEGEDVWLAVQIFAKPLSACPPPDANLKHAVGGIEAELVALRAQIDSLRAELGASKPKTRPEVEEHNEKVALHNELAAKYNSALDSLKILIEEYNKEINEFNACVAN